jgi:hypothetical protein
LVTIPLGVLGIIGGIIGILGSLAGLLGCIAAEGTFDSGRHAVMFAVLFAGSVALLASGGVLLFRK